MRIVVGVDGSDASLTATELVTTTIWPIGTTIRLVSAYELPMEWTGIAQSNVGAEDEPTGQLLRAIQALADPLRLRGYATEAVVARGRPADVLLAEAGDLHADLIVVGSRGRGVAASALLGSVSAALVDHAACPVLVARGPRVTRILVGTDGSQSAEAIPTVLQNWDLFREAPIDVLSVAPVTRRSEGTILPPGTESGGATMPDASHEVDRHRVMATEMAARLVALGWRAESARRTGEAAREIEAAAAEWGTDLIITGSRGLTGLRRLLLGSVAHHVLLHARCSVLVMRGHVPARQPLPVPLPAVQGA